MLKNRSLLFFTAVLLNCSCMIFAQIKPNNTDMEKLIERQVKMYPSMELQDVYKFLMQAALGSEHAVPDSAFVQKWMNDEIKNLDWNHMDSLIEPLLPDGQIIRVNLRPYIKAGYDTNILLHAFIQTANNFKGSRDTLEKFLNIVLKMIDEGKLKFSRTDAAKYFIELKKKGYPAVHHSEKYEELYSPAYRVVEKKYVSFLFDKK